MKRLILILTLAMGVKAFDIQYSVDPAFCIRTQTEYSVCAFSVPMYNFMKYGKMRLAEEKKGDKADKKKIQKLKEKAKFEFRKACYLWDTMSPMAQKFFINWIMDGDVPVVNEGEMEELCLKLAP